MTLLPDLIGDSPPLVAVRAQVEHLLRRQSESRRPPPVLILGETGTGKGLLARAMHDAGPRGNGPFVSINCAAIPETLLEAELFGFERGAFTDARQAKAGLFQTAHRGTLFLDEIGLLPENLQAKLLTVLEDRVVRRLGSTRTEPVDVWIVTATSEDLKAGARRGGFREELFHRLAVVTIRLPALRERGGDILTLAAHFLARTCSEYGLDPKTLADDARAALVAYRWPGNVRELANVMERVALLTEATIVTAQTLQLPVPRGRLEPPSAHSEAALVIADPGTSLEEAVGQAERERILAVLRETRWNISRAAVRLEVTRNTLRYRMQKYGLAPPGSSAETEETSDRASDSVEVPTGPRPLHVQWDRRHIALLYASLVTGGAVANAGPVLEALIEKVQSFGGHVEDVSPRGLVAAFGLEPVEDAARRAAHAALAIQKSAAQARRGAVAFPALRMGLHVGDLVVARVGGTGRVDHEAKRAAWTRLEPFMDAVEPDAILVTEATRPFLERRFVVAPLATPEGTAGEMYRLVGLGRTGLGLGERLTPFVGRGDELEHFVEALTEARDGHGRVVAVVGEPGVGKSRLIWEFIDSRRIRNARVLVTSAVSYGQATPYLPVTELLRAYFEIEARDVPGEIHKRVGGRLATLGPALSLTLPALVALLDVSDDAGWQALDAYQKQRRTLDAVKRLLLEESRRQPLVVVLEDLHWIDSKTQALLDDFVESIRSERVLLLVSYRPEYQDRWTDKTHHGRVRVDPLSPDSAHALLDGLLGRAPALAPIKAALIERTGGNPFFLEESVRTLVETGVLAGERGAYRPARLTGDIQVPATVQAVLATRIERLAAEDRALLQTAAIIGRDVPFGLLQAVAEVPDEPIRGGLARLRASEFVHETRLVPELEYAFKHALSHEVTYASVPEDRRRNLHARSMEAIERLHASRLAEHVDRLAHHARRGEVWAKAVAYLRQAGARAAGRSAYREAVACFEQAIEAITHLPESRQTIEQGIDLRLDLRNSLNYLGMFQPILDHLREAEILAERIGDQRRLGWISAGIAHYFWLVGEADRALEVGHRALGTAEALQDLSLQVVAALRLAYAYHRVGDFPRAHVLFQRNIEALQGDLIRERFGETGLVSVLSRIFLARSLTEIGEFAEGIARGEEAVRIAETVDHPLSLTGAYFVLGFVYLHRGDFETAISFLQRARGLAQAWNIPPAYWGMATQLGNAYVLSGRLADGLPLLELGLEGGVAMGERGPYGIRLAYLSEAYWRAHRMDDAARLATKGLDFCRASRQRADEAWALRAVAEVAAHRDPPDASVAEAAYHQAIALADELGMRPVVAHGHLGLGTLYWRLDKPQLAREHLTTAARMYRDLKMDFWLDQAAMALESSTARP